MPVTMQEHGATAAARRLLRMVADWRQRRAVRRRAQLHTFIGLSDRMLADIGVRRADVHAAVAGVVPAQHLGRTHGGTPWSAPVHRLCPKGRQPSEALAATDLSAAA